MAGYKVTFMNCVIEVENIDADNDDQAIEKAKDIVCIQAGTKTDFDVWLGDVFAEREK